MNSSLLHHNRIPQIALLGAALVLLYSIYHTGILLVGLPDLQADTASISQRAMQTTPLSVPKQENYAQISTWHLFGNPEQARKDAPAIPAQAPETHLKLELLGIFFNQETNQGWAIIAEQGKPDKTYRVNDKISGNAVIQSIETDRVILERNGRFESLSLKKYPE